MTSYLISVDTERSEQKGCKCDRNHEGVGRKRAGDRSEFPLTRIRSHQYIGRHRDKADDQVSDSQVQYEPIDTLLAQFGTAGDGDDDYDVA